jgi:hypothetical protein
MTYSERHLGGAQSGRVSLLEARCRASRAQREKDSRESGREEPIGGVRLRLEAQSWWLRELALTSSRRAACYWTEN